METGLEAPFDTDEAPLPKLSPDGGRGLGGEVVRLDSTAFLQGEEVREKWDRIYSALPGTAPQPSLFLMENAHLLPKTGEALDLACGLGGNALFLARRGLRVSAWDISRVAIERLDSVAGRSGLGISAQTRDVEQEPFPQETFDVIVVTRFLARKLALPIKEALKPEGLLFYQTFIRKKIGASGPGNKDYLLAENELLDLFKDLRVVVYREEGRIGDLASGSRDEAYFIGQKRPARQA